MKNIFHEIFISNENVLYWMMSMSVSLTFQWWGKIRWAKHSWFQLYEVFRGALATSVHYLPKAKNSRENFHGKLKNRENRESLAQRIFPRLRYTHENFMLHWGCQRVFMAMKFTCLRVTPPMPLQHSLKDLPCSILSGMLHITNVSV